MRIYVMAIYDPQFPLFSLHLPKTGGTTLLSVLPLWFPPGQVLFHYRRPYLQRMPRRHDPDAGDIVHGHFANDAATGLYTYYPGARQCVVFLRDPFERLVSHYFQMRKEALANDIPPAALEDFFEWYMNSPEERATLEASNFLPPDFTAANVVKLAEERFVHLGLYEHFANSLLLLAAKLNPIHRGYDGLRYLPRLRANPRGTQIPRGLRQRFEAAFGDGLEYRLWRHAQSLHAEEVQSVLT